MNPPVNEQGQKEMQDKMAQKIKAKVPNDRPEEMEIEALRSPQGANIANNSSVNDNMQPN